MKIPTTLSLDMDVKHQARVILETQDKKLSTVVNSLLKKFIAEAKNEK